MSDNLWTALERATILTAVVTSVYSAVSWARQHRRERQLRQSIRIQLTTLDRENVRYELSIRPPRRLITRAEVLGLLGMLPSKEAGRRFSWDWLHHPEFLNDLVGIYEGESDILQIPLNDEEFSQLRLPPGDSETMVPRYEA